MITETRRMNPYKYQRRVRLAARLVRVATSDEMAASLFPDVASEDIARARAVRRRRLDFFNVTDGRITSVRALNAARNRSEARL